MIVCRNCGFHNADADAFCGSCGQFLEWTGERLDAETPVEVSPPAPSATPAEPPASAPAAAPATSTTPATALPSPPTPAAPIPAATNSAPAPTPTLTGGDAAPVVATPPAPAAPPAEPPAEPEQPKVPKQAPAPGEWRPAVGAPSSRRSSVTPTGFTWTGLPGARATGTGAAGAGAAGAGAAGTASPGTAGVPSAGKPAGSTAAAPSKPAAAPPKPASTYSEAAALVAPIPQDTEPTRATGPDRGVQPGPARPAARTQPPPMTPQADRRRPPPPATSAPPTRQLQPDDLICGNCGEGNPPTRKFCSRCGASLQTAAVVPTPPTPWWRKIQKFFELRLRPLGSRPNRRFRGLSSISRLIRRVLVAAVVLLALAYAIFPPLRGAVNSALGSLRDRIESIFTVQYVPVHPTSTVATAAMPGHGAELATDGIANDFWAAPDAAAQPTLVLGFDNPTKLVGAAVHSGDSDDPRGYGRPDKLHLVFFNGPTLLGTADVELTDTTDEQKVTFDGKPGATSVEVHIVSVYRSVSSPAVALSEIEFSEQR